MNNKEIFAVAMACIYCFFKLAIVLSAYVKTNGHTENVQYEYRSHGKYSYKKTVVTWSEAFTGELLLNFMCAFLVIYAFMPNWLTFFISKKAKNKLALNDVIYDNLRQKIIAFNEFYQGHDIDKFRSIATFGFYDFHTHYIQSWLNKDMEKFIQVFDYRRLRVLDINSEKNEVMIMSFERRYDYLKYKGKPLRRQDTSSSWDYMLYQFVIENGDWKLNNYRKDPSDKELFKYLFK